jgi:hypothetical protein
MESLSKVSQLSCRPESGRICKEHTDEAKADRVSPLSCRPESGRICKERTDEAKADRRISLCHVDRSRAAFARSAQTKEGLTDLSPLVMSTGVGPHLQGAQRRSKG